MPVMLSDIQSIGDYWGLSPSMNWGSLLTSRSNEFIYSLSDFLFVLCLAGPQSGSRVERGQPNKVRTKLHAVWQVGSKKSHCEDELRFG